MKAPTNSSLSELKEAIQKSHNTVVGPDEIHDEFLRQLSPKSLEYLLTALNILKNSKLPESWKLATIIPISKPGKNNLYAANYRPISLRNCPCKTMERMVYKRIVWFIEPIIFLPTSNAALGTEDQRWIMWSDKKPPHERQLYKNNIL